MEIELLRKSFKPAQVKLLLVGESQPASGDFFYKMNSNLFHQTKQALLLARENSFYSDKEFLAFFRDCGCYLDDLCLEPVNRLEEEIRRSKRAEWTPSLATRLRDYNPQFVVCVMKGIRQFVRNAIDAAGIEPIIFETLPFPVRSSTNILGYQNGLASILRRTVL